MPANCWGHHHHRPTAMDMLRGESMVLERWGGMVCSLEQPKSTDLDVQQHCHTHKIGNGFLSAHGGRLWGGIGFQGWGMVPTRTRSGLLFFWKHSHPGRCVPTASDYWPSTADCASGNLSINHHTGSVRYQPASVNLQPPSVHPQTMYPLLHTNCLAQQPPPPMAPLLTLHFF